MRFMVLMIPKIYQPGHKVDPNFTPQAKDIEKMGAFNEQLSKLCTITALDGLKPLANGARLSYTEGKATVTDGSLVEAKEVLGGFWILEAPSKDKVIEWFKRCPAQDGDTIEIRPFFEITDFPEDAQKVAR